MREMFNHNMYNQIKSNNHLNKFNKDLLFNNNKFQKKVRLDIQIYHNLLPKELHKDYIVVGVIMKLILILNLRLV